MMSVHSNSAALSEQERKQLAKLEERLGHSFENDQLLFQSLCHKSYAADNNERLEFIGDAVLGYVVASDLHTLYEDAQEDVLTLMRSRLVMGRALAEVAREIGLPEHIRLGSGELKSGGRHRDSIVADAFEAVIGAIHEDGGIEAARGVIRRLFEVRMRDLPKTELKDAKTMLQEVLQGAALGLPVYSVEDISGADHARLFKIRCEVTGLGVGDVGSASSRRRAEQQAAAKVLKLIEDQDLV
jgi:ribonuclease-3